MPLDARIAPAQTVGQKACVIALSTCWGDLVRLLVDHVLRVTCTRRVDSRSVKCSTTTRQAPPNPITAHHRQHIVMFNWFHKFGSPRWCYGILGRLCLIAALATGLLLVVGVVWGLAFAPVDYQQGHSYRIMFIHVPAAFLAQSIYLMMAGAAAVFLIWRMKLADLAVQCAAPVGASITFLALATGALWGMPTWGTFWEWDARMTSTLVLFFLFVGMIALRSGLEYGPAAARACAILAIVGAVNIPIIKYSVEWWYSLHQTSSITLTEKPSMPASMWMPLLIMVVAYYGFFFTVWMMRIRTEILHRERRTGWVRDLTDGATQ